MMNGTTKVLRHEVLVFQIEGRRFGLHIGAVEEIVRSVSQTPLTGGGRSFEGIIDLLCPGGCLVLVGMPQNPVPLDVVALQIKEARVESVFRYANIFPRAIQLIASGRIDVKPFISRTFPFAEGIKAFEEAASGKPTDVKVQIVME